MPKLSVRDPFVGSSNHAAAFWSRGLQPTTAASRLSRHQGWYAALGYAHAHETSRAIRTVAPDAVYTLRNVFNQKADLDWYPLIDDVSVSRRLPWARLATLNRAHIVEEEQFDQMLRNERFRSFAQGLDPREALYHGKQALQNTHSSLTLLRKLFLLPYTVKLITYIERTDVLGVFSRNFPERGAAHVESDDLEQAKANCYPFPMLDVTAWRINHYECDPSVFTEARPEVDPMETLIWETTICPFTSTFRYLEALCQEYAKLVDPKYPTGFTYNDATDNWCVLNTLHDPVVPIRLAKFADEFMIPVPAGLISRRDVLPVIDILDLFKNGFTLMATAMYRLYHLHRLLSVAVSIDDRCLQHQTQLLIDSHIPMWSFMTQHNCWRDGALLSPLAVRDNMHESVIRHPLAPEALAAYAGAHAAPTKEVIETTPLVYLLWPAATRWIVSAEEAPHLMNGLSQTGFTFRYSHEHTAIQNWDDPKTAFVALFNSKMGLFRSRIRSDHTIAKECFTRHPIMATILLLYLHIVQLGNIPGTTKRPSFLTRLRLWITYRSSPQNTRDIQWVADHCFKRYRYAMRFGMHELFGFYLRFMPALKQSLLSHPHQGIMYGQWLISAVHACNMHRSRLELIPVSGLSIAKETHAAYIEMLLCRHYNALLKHLNFAAHHGVFSEFIERFFSGFYNSLLSRVEVTLRAFNKDYAPKATAPTQSTRPSTSSVGGAAENADTPAEEDEHFKGLLEEMELALEENQYGRADADDNDDDDDDDDEALTVDSLATRLIASTSSSHSHIGTEQDAEYNPRPSRTKLSRMRKDHDGVQLWAYGNHEIRSVHRTFLDNLLYVPQLDDEGTEEVNELFKRICFMVQRYHGARQRLPLLFLGYFGVSEHVFQRMFMFYIYYLQALPYHRLSVMIRRLWLDYPRDCALVWRYLQYIRMFSTEQGILLPEHITRHQLTAREYTVFLSSATARQKQPHTNVGIFYYCPNCKTWAHQIAPEFSMCYTRTARSDCFKCEAIRHSRMKILVNSVTSTQSRAAASGTASVVAFKRRGQATEDDKNASGSPGHRARVLLYRSEEWRSYYWDYHMARRICTNDIRRRVTGAVGNKVALSILHPKLRQQLTGADKIDSEEFTAAYVRWMKYARLVALFPLRQAEKESLNKKFQLYPDLLDNQAAGQRKRRRLDHGKAALGDDGEDDEEDDNGVGDVVEDDTIGDEDHGDEDDENFGDPEKMTPAVRKQLSNYWLNDADILSGATDGMKHAEVLEEVRPLIAHAASTPAIVDSSSVCGYPLVPIDMVGRIIGLPTQYTCIWRNYTPCSICGMLMMAHEWRYSPEYGYICSLHRSTQPIDVEHMGLVWPARPVTTLPISAAAAATTPKGAADAGMDLQIQRRYYITRVKQLAGLPGEWLHRYGVHTAHEAAGLLPTQPTMGGAISDESSLDPRIYCCTECDAKCDETAVQQSFYYDIVHVLRVTQRTGVVESKRFCQKCYKAWIKRQRQSIGVAPPK